MVVGEGATGKDALVLAERARLEKLTDREQVALKLGLSENDG